MCVNYYVCVTYKMPACPHSVQDAEETESRPQETRSIVGLIQFWLMLTPLAVVCSAEDGV